MLGNGNRFWNKALAYFKESTSGGMNSLMANRGIFSKVNVPKYMFLLSKNVSSLINFGLTLCIFFLFALIDGVDFGLHFLALIYPICCLVVFNIGVGLVLSALFVFFRDISYLYDIFTLLLMISGSMTLFFAILLLKASFSFWTIEGMEAMNIISDGGREVSSYPINIYVKWFANIFTFILPFGMVNYFPLQYLLGRENVPFWYGLSPLATLVFMGFSFLIWKIGLKQYASTGS